MKYIKSFFFWYCIFIKFVEKQINEFDNELEKNEEESTSFDTSSDNSVESFSMCDFIIKQAVGLKKE